MNTTHKFVRTAITLIGIFSILFSSLQMQPLPVSAQGQDGIQRDYNTETGKVSHITGAGNEPITVMGAMSEGMTSTQRSDVLVERFAPEFGLVEPSEELIVADESQPEADRVVTKYQQVHQGVPVLGGELIVNASDKGELYSMNGEVSQGLDLDTAPAVSVETAIDMAKQGMFKWYGGNKADYQHTDAALYIFDESILRPSMRPAELVWKIEMTPVEQGQPIRELVLVNAKTGNIPLHFNQVDTGWEDTQAEPLVQYDDPAPTETPVPTVTPNPTETTQSSESSSSIYSTNSVTIQSGTIRKVYAASNNFQEIINIAQSGDTIQVQAGTYTYFGGNVISVNKNLNISGGWNSNWTVQNGNSIIDGQNARNAVLINGATVTMDRFTIQNGITGDGGGIYLYGSTFTLTNSNVNNNKGSRGAGIFVYGSSTLNLINSTINDNLATSSGGGIFVANQSSATIQYSTISRNSSNGSGGGLSRETPTNPDKQVSLESSIIAFNSAVTNAPDCYGYIDNSEYSIISNTAGCNATPGLGDQFNVDPKISITTIGSPAYFTLSNDSPAIESANSAYCPTTDQRGMPRPRWNNCDIGSYEYAPEGGLGIVGGSGQATNIGLNFSSPLIVSLVDSSGNPIPNVIITFSAPTSGASGIFTSNGRNEATALTDTNGQATSPTFTANNIDGAYTVVATAVGVLGVVNFNLINSKGVFVATTGSDINTCRTIADPCATINAAIAKVYTGEAIRVGQGIYTGSTSDPIVTVMKNLVISGGWNADFSAQNGQTIIDGENRHAGFKINPGKVVELNNLTIQNGYASQGAGIYNEGSLTLKNVTVSNNVTYNDGAGIYQKSGSLNLTNVTISNNTGRSSGGGIYIYDGTVNINNSTITQNVAEDPDALAIGGGLSNYFNKPLTIRNTIIAGNGADTVPDCRGQITSGGHNLIGYGDGCVMAPMAGDQIGSLGSPINAKLGNLLVNGGTTYTHALLTGSPAIDAGDPSSCAPTDQRGVSRPQGAACDIGAFEGSSSQTVNAVIRTYTANHANAIPGTLVCDQSNPDCGSQNADANSAHRFALGTYNLYLEQFGRNGIDDNNMPILSTVQYQNNYQNASWIGSLMLYGDGYGFANADDVVAHELTHGVTQYESNLLYFYQSGAINEALSDLFGEYYDQNNNTGNDTEDVKWLIGEDVTGWTNPAPQPLLGQRSMSDPTAFYDPDMMTSGYYYRGTSNSVQVHRNSGINNKAVYLMVDGGGFNGQTVTGIGWDKTAAIYYEAQTHLLTSGSDYSDLYYALQQACVNLIGQKGIVSSDCTQVKKAIDAVQMNSEPVPGFNPDAPACPTGMSTAPAVTLFQDNFENGTTNWGLNGAWKVDTQFASSGTHEMWGDDEPTYGDSYLTTQNAISIPAGTTPFLYFKHAFAFEYDAYGYYDGAVLEYSKDNGSTWIDAQSLYSAGKNYTGIVAKPPLGYESYGSVLQGRYGFVGDSHGYVSSRYDLKPLAGQTVQFRWRFSTDFTGNYLGWFVDDVSIYQCVGTPAIPAPQTPLTNTLTTDYTPYLNWSDVTPSLHHYQVQIATDNNFISLVYNQNDLPTSEFTVPTNLPSDTTYYWRVQALNAVGGSLGWSSVWTFRTALLPPALVWPAQDEHVLSLRPAFNWDDVPNATGYTIEISTTNTFTTPMVGNPTLSTFTPETDLPIGVLYWHVKTNGSNGPSNWSVTRSYNGPNPPPAPSLGGPTNNRQILNLAGIAPTFSWRDVSVPAGTTFKEYQFQLGTSVDFVNPLVNITLTDTSYQPALSMTSNTIYYWRVRAFNTVDESGPWSEIWSFSIPPQIPSLLLPANDAQLLSLRPTFEWNPVGNAGYYTIQISKDSTFTQLVMDGVSSSQTYTPQKDLPSGLTLYWRVRAEGSGGSGIWSAVQTFVTPTPPGIPGLILPASDASMVEFSPIFMWSLGILPRGTQFDHSQLQVSSDPTFSTLTIDQNIARSSSLRFTPAVGLSPNTQYYWRIRAFNTDNEMSSWSDVRSFKTRASIPDSVRPIAYSVDLNLPIPGIVPPTDHSTTNALRPILDWTDVTDSSSYIVQVSTDAEFTSSALIVSATTIPSGYGFIKNVPTGVTLYWRVMTVKANTISNWSPVYTLQIP